MKIKTLLSLLAPSFMGTAHGQSNPRPLQVDTTITRFRRAADFQGTLVYTLNGPSDIQTKNPTAFSVTQAPNVSLQDAKDQLDMLLNMSQLNGFVISDLAKRDTTINGMKAFVISYKETLKEEGYSNLVFNGVLVNGNGATIFTSGDLSGGKYADLFRKTFYAIKP